MVSFRLRFAIHDPHLPPHPLPPHFQIGLPQGLPSYLHRSGRTGRAGKAGLALLLHSATKQELDFVRDLKRSVRNLKEEDLAERPTQRYRDFDGGHQGYQGNQRRGQSYDRGGNRWDGGGGGGGGRFSRRDSGYNNREDDRGYRSRGGSAGRFQPRKRDYYEEDDGGYDLNRRGRGRSFDNDRRQGGRSAMSDDEFNDDDDDSFGGERRVSSQRRGNNDRAWVRDVDLQGNFGQFLAQRHSSGGSGGGARGRNSRRDENDEDNWF